MSKRKTKLADGWQMTPGQRACYWRYWQDVCRILKWNPTDEARRDWHELAGLGRCSAKDIDRMKGFDAIKAHWLSVVQPNNLDAQLAQINQPKHRLITRITEMAPESYWRAILTGPRFKAQSLDDLNEEQLTQFRNTLEDRMGKKEDVPF